MLFDSSTGLARVILLGASAYLALITILRISGKRTLAKMNAFDLVVTIAWVRPSRPSCSPRMSRWPKACSHSQSSSCFSLSLRFLPSVIGGSSGYCDIKKSSGNWAFDQRFCTAMMECHVTVFNSALVTAIQETEVRRKDVERVLSVEFCGLHEAVSPKRRPPLTEMEGHDRAKSYFQM